MKPDDSEDTELIQPSDAPLAEGVRPSVRARQLFAEGGEEFLAWDLVARQLDPDTHIHVVPEARASYAGLLAKIRGAEAHMQPPHGMRAASESRRDKQWSPEPIAEASHVSTHPLNRTVNRRFSSRIWGAFIVGSLAVVINVAAYTLLAHRSNQHDLRVSGITYATRNGERTSIVLSDGTKVMLNVGSRLQVSPMYGTQTRSVFLEGEAEFTVEHNAASPFMVHAGTTVIRDLATRFSVRAYRDVGRTTVAVAEGRVAVHASTLQQPSSAVLDVGHVATISLGQGLSVGEQRSPADYFGWTSGLLTFQHVPIGEALAQIARWYDVDCEVSDPKLLASDLTFSFTEKTLTDKQLQDLGDVLEARVVRQGRLITFTSRSR